MSFLKHISFFFVLLTMQLFSLVHCASLKWVGQIKTDSTFNINDMHVDQKGNVYLTGSFTGTVDFDLAPNQMVLTATGRSDIFIAKYSSSGKLKWAKQMVSLDSAKFSFFWGIGGTAVKTDTAGNVFYAGSFKGSVDFDPSSSVAIKTTAKDDLFLSKLDSNGNLVWISQFETINHLAHNRILDLNIVLNRFLVITGDMQGTVNFNPMTSSDTLSVKQGEEVYIAKYRLNGDFVWVKQFLTSYSSYSWSISNDSLGNIYTAGSFNGTVDFDPDTGQFIIEHIGGTSFACFISKLDSNGYFVFAKALIPKDYHSNGQPSDVGGRTIHINKKGNIVLGGDFNVRTDFDPDTSTFFMSPKFSNQNGLYSRNKFIMELDASGNFNWAVSFIDLYGGFYSMELDDFDNIYCTGEWGGDVDFDPGPNVFKLNDPNGIYILKLNDSGQFIGVINIEANSLYGSPGHIGIDGRHDLYVAGKFVGTGDFDPGAGSHFLTSTIKEDGFLTKINSTNLSIQKSPFIYFSAKAYPNPTNGNLHIGLSNSIYNSISITVRGAMGQKIATYSFLKNETIEINIDSNPGLYFLELTTDNGTKSILRVIKSDH